MATNSASLAISRQLVLLAVPELSLADRELLLMIINQLFLDLAAGHSCSYLRSLSEVLALKPTVVVQLLLASGLTSEYCQVPVKLRAATPENSVRPLSVLHLKHDGLIFISKYLAYEMNVTNCSNALISAAWPAPTKCYQRGLATLTALAIKTKRPNLEQLAAIKSCSAQRLSILTGGPGTGKTTTIVLLLWLLYQQYGPQLIVKVCAPTGKAAMRVRDSIKSQIDHYQNSSAANIDFSVFEQHLLNNEHNFGTLHKLLGYQPQSIYFKHNHSNKLAIEVLIVDESSMVGLALFSKLFDALDPNILKHLIFLGDKNQLSSVEEGHVFASLVEALKESPLKDYDLFSYRDPVVSELVQSNRGQGEINLLARAILAQDMRGVTDLIKHANQVKLTQATLSSVLTGMFANNNRHLLDYIDACQRLAADAILNVKALFAEFARQSLLCLTNHGILGSVNLNRQIEHKIRQYLGATDSWYTGKPIIILQNDYALELFNGDIGICVLKKNRVSIIFESGREFIPEVLPEYQLAYAITIHKSQGSEYDHVNVVVAANEQHGLLSRELIYTAVTRARQSVNLYCDEETLRHAIERVTVRNSGLKHFLTAQGVTKWYNSV